MINPRYERTPQSMNTRRDVLPALLKQMVEKISFDRLPAYLPFQSRVIVGYHFNHIQSLSGFDIVTERRVVTEGNTLCGRHSFVGYVTEMDENCPGCEAIAQGLVAREITNA